MVPVANFGPLIPPKVQQKVLARQQDIATGRPHPLVVAGRTLGEAELQAMQWLAEGVPGGPPPR